MQTDIRSQYRETLDMSHHGRPEVIHTVRTGNRGRPRIKIDPIFLKWAYTQRTTSGIARFLNVSRDTVRNALLSYGIAQPQEAPFNLTSFAETDSDDLLDDFLDPNIGIPGDLPADVHDLQANLQSNPAEQSTISFTGPVSIMTDEELDDIVIRLRAHFRRAGLSMLDGMLRRLGHRLPRERIRASLMRIDPVQRVFQRIRIRRRTYSVPGPMSLWHHDGQHGLSLDPSHLILLLILQLGLIRWGIIIHGFIDGYSRIITGLRASDNNRGETVLDLFLSAAEVYGVPSRIRGDHGVENILLAAWMERHRGERRGSYIWGRYLQFRRYLIELKIQRINASILGASTMSG